MPDFDPEAAAPVRRPDMDPRSGPPTRETASTDTSPPAADRPVARGSDADGSETADQPADARPAGERVGARAPEPAEVRARQPAGEHVLPDITTDERDIGWGDLPEPSDDDRYLRDVPPPHES